MSLLSQDGGCRGIFVRLPSEGCTEHVLSRQERLPGTRIRWTSGGSKHKKQYCHRSICTPDYTNRDSLLARTSPLKRIEDSNER